MKARGAWKRAALAALVAATLHAQPAPVVFQTAPGKFEIVAADAAAARVITTAADEAWRTLAAPLALPEAFSSPVFVRIVPSQDWAELAAFHVVVEPGGIVSVRLPRTGVMQPEVVRRALVQALLLRLAVSRHGVRENLAAPLWLEQAGAGWWRTHADLAQLDALKQETESLAPPPLVALFGWQRGEEEPRVLSAGAVWLLTFLRAESPRGVEWGDFLNRVLGGEEGGAALAAAYRGRFSTAAEREQWWLAGWHHNRRVRTLPTPGAEESRALLAEATRFVLARDGRDEVFSFVQLRAARREPVVAEVLRMRAQRVGRDAAAVHPFYRNAALSLARLLTAAGVPEAMGEREFVAARAQFEADLRDADELATATTHALDALAR